MGGTKVNSTKRAGYCPCIFHVLVPALRRKGTVKVWSPSREYRVRNSHGRRLRVSWTHGRGHVHQATETCCLCSQAKTTVPIRWARPPPYNMIDASPVNCYHMSAVARTLCRGILQSSSARARRTKLQNAAGIIFYSTLLLSSCAIRVDCWECML